MDVEMRLTCSGGREYMAVGIAGSSLRGKGKLRTPE